MAQVHIPPLPPPPPPPPPSIVFDFIRRSSIEFLSKDNITTNTLFKQYISEPNTTAAAAAFTQNDLLPIIEAQGFFSMLKDLLLTALNNHLHPSTKDQVDSLTLNNTLSSFMAAISRFTDESLESIARSSNATLRALDLRGQDFAKNLRKAKVSVRVFKVMFQTTAIILTSTLASPVATTAVEPLMQRFDPLWNAMENYPYKEKQNVLEIIRFKTHSAIVELGRIKDIIQGLKTVVAESKSLEEVEKAVVAALIQVEMAGMELSNLMDM